ncbi:MAG: hypothetical protein HGA67_01275 [Candidatus Yonathbacteria bacterium]|nr:hypothetical protein [Candidatus Yonathbacteria bacterium]
MKEVDLSDFPSMLEKLEKRQEVVDSFKEAVDALAEYIKKGFCMKPEGSKEFRIAKERAGCYRVIVFFLSGQEYCFFYFDEEEGKHVSSPSKNICTNNLMSDPGFIRLLPELVAKVREDLLAEIQNMEEMAEFVRRSSLD